MGGARGETCVLLLCWLVGRLVLFLLFVFGGSYDILRIVGNVWGIGVGVFRFS